MSQFSFSYANLSNLSYIEDLYQRYLSDPDSVEASWRNFFDGMAFASTLQRQGGAVGEGSDDLRVYHLIQAYRTYGHLLAAFDPIAVHPPKEPEELNLQKLGFKPEELERPFPTCGFLKETTAPLKTLVEALKKTYCRTIGIEYMGLVDPAVEVWLQKHIEPYFKPLLNLEQKLMILHYLNKSELFESFLHTKYVGQKRFSLEGGETLIPILATIIEEGAKADVGEVILGMAHRGRLNVLTNILNKSYGQVFNEFEDQISPEEFEGTGDVKYHKGFKGSLKTSLGKEVGVILMANPSHLESVDSVVEGQVRLRQEQKKSKEQKKEIVPILIHGDAALAGQGIVYETMQLGRLNGYGTGGTLHIVINNQIGFTTVPKDSRSTRYCTDIAHAFGAPVFHVNAENPEECVYVAKLAIELRQQFGCDVFIDLNCYRKYGHNEGDEPTFTQPLEYKLIKQKKSIREIFKQQLIDEGALDQNKAQILEEEFRKSLQSALDAAKNFTAPRSPKLAASQENSARNDLFTPFVTNISNNTLIEIAEHFCTIPKNFNLHPKIQRLVEDRLKMVKADPSQATIDWGMGEHLAYGSLLWEGIQLRLSGQDSRRGTFSHRHAMWIDQLNETKYFPLSHLKEGQGLFDVFNSSLSEYAVLGFEFGYSLFSDKKLVIWEAQFGDFANGAQIIIDQYISSSEQKWMHASDIVLKLPHGYEGQGPEHSSGRIERFLQLCGHDNMQIVNCTTPSQLFHVLRRQALRGIKKPLIIFTPKALLRSSLCVSALNELSNGSFQEILDDPKGSKNPKKLVLCSGKIFYEISEEREKRKFADMTILRIEQLYPMHKQKLKELMQKYTGFKQCYWVQEEHSNMGAWEYMQPILLEMLKDSSALHYAGRDRSAATATGSHQLHKEQAVSIIEEVFKS